MSATIVSTVNLSRSQVNTVVETLATVGFDNRYNRIHDAILDTRNYGTTGTLVYSERLGGVQLVSVVNGEGNITSITVVSLSENLCDQTKVAIANAQLASVLA